MSTDDEAHIAEPPTPLGGGIPADPAFFTPTTELNLRLPSPEWRTRYVENFAHRISRRPEDLIIHTLRIELLLSTGKASDVLASDALFDALVDLFIVLGERGLALRRRLLARAALQLPLIRYRQLSQALTNPQAILRAVPGSQSRLWYPPPGPPLVEVVFERATTESRPALPDP
ncbi:hypothetical protein [Endothiovibrio diazotrophicus]